MAFCRCGKLTSIIIPDNVTTIGEWAFGRCGSLTSITIGKAVKFIGDDAFQWCSKLDVIDVNKENPNFCFDDNILFNKDKTVLIKCLENKTGAYTIPETVIEISKSAFLGVMGLTAATIPDGVTTIGKYAFSDCEALTSLSIGAGVVAVGNYTFNNCYSLTNVIIGRSVAKISESAFQWCGKLDVIDVSPENPNFCFEDDILFNKDKTVLIKCLEKRKGAYTIPHSVTTIGRLAFEDCDGLTSIIISGSVTDIASHTFARCSNLNSVTFGAGIKSVDEDAFFMCSSSIKTMNFLSLVPPVVKRGLFERWDIEDCELCVPQETADSYMTANVLKNFFTIYAISDDNTKTLARCRKDLMSGYDFCDENSSGIAIVGKDGKFGYVNRCGERITPLKYDGAAPFKRRFAKVQLNGKWGLINREGKETTPLIYDEIKKYHSVTVAVRLGNKYGYISAETGNVVIPIMYDDAERLHITRQRHNGTGDIARVKLGDKRGCIDERGKVIIPIIYDDIVIADSNLNMAKYNGKWGFISAKGKKIIDFEYDDVSEFHNNLARVQKNGKYGFINTKGTVVIKLKYDDCKADTCYGNLLAVAMNGAAGFINKKTKKIVIPCMYEPDFENRDNYCFNSSDYANVKLGGKWGVIDKKNRVVIPFLYDAFFHNPRAVFRYGLRDGKKWKIDPNGAEQEMKKNPHARTFKDYVHAVEWAQVAESLNALHDIHCGLDLFETNFNNFKTKQFKHSDDIIRIYKREIDYDEEKTDSVYDYKYPIFHVDLFCTKSETTYTFFDWAEILDMEVRIEDNLTFTDAEIVAACIYRASDGAYLTEEDIEAYLKSLRLRMY